MRSADFDQKKRSVINALNAVLRTGALKEQDVGQQRLVLLVDQLLERAGPNSPLRLGPVYDHLKERGLDEEDIVETLLVFKEREATFDLPLALPPAIEQLSAERKQQLLLRYQKRQTHARPKPPSGPHEVGPAPMEPVKRPSGQMPTRTKALVGALVAVLVLAGVALVWLNPSEDPGSTPIVLDEPRGLPCKELKANQGVLFCWMEKAAYEGLSTDERKSRARATKAAATPRGFHAVQVWTLEDTKLREVH